MNYVVNNSVSAANDKNHSEADKPLPQLSFKKATEAKAPDNIKNFTMLKELDRHASPLQAAANDQHHNKLDQHKHMALETAHKVKEAFISATMATAIVGIFGVVSVVHALTREKDLPAKPSEP